LRDNVATPFRQPADGDPGVIVADSTGNTVQELEGVQMNIVERFGAPAGKGAAEQSNAESQRHNEERRLDEPTADVSQGVCEIGLGLP
jgi:hypothetical protein